MLKAVLIIAAVFPFILGCASHVHVDTGGEPELDMAQYQPGPAPDNSQAHRSDQHPRLIFKKIPQYPPLALANEVEGFVIIQAYVNKHGKVTRARAVKCSMPEMGFEAAAVKAAYLCKFKPAIRHGKSIGLWVEYRVDFTLQ